MQIEGIRNNKKNAKFFFFFTHIDAKILKLPSSIQQHMKKQYIITKWASFQKSKDGSVFSSFDHINRPNVNPKDHCPWILR